jgi:hypothetical protein
MEPHREEPQRAPPPGAEPKPKRFRIVKLEERIAPSKGGGTKNCSNGATACVCANPSDTGGATCGMCTWGCI